LRGSFEMAKQAASSSRGRSPSNKQLFAGNYNKPMERRNQLPPVSVLMPYPDQDALDIITGDAVDHNIERGCVIDDDDSL